MKRTASIRAAVVCSGLLLLAAVSHAEEGPPRAVSVDGSLSLVLPAGWDAEENPDTFAKAVLVVRSPRETPDDPFRENICVHAEALPRRASFAQYLHNTKALLAHTLTDYRLLAEMRTTIGGHRACRLVYAFNADHQRKNIVYLVKRRNTVYVLTCSSVTCGFERWEPVMNKTVETLLFLK